jgi:hypothetical protein
VKSSFLFGLTLLPSLSYGSPASPPVCERTSEFVENQIAGSRSAIRGKVTTVENEENSTPGVQPITHVQRLTYEVLESWKGPVQVGSSFHVTVQVTSACAGLGCVFPFKVGDVTLVLSPPSRPFSAPAFFEGCWIHQGVVVSSVLMLSSMSDNFGS